MTARNKVLTIMGIIILIGIISIGFFVFPIGISMCAITEAYAMAANIKTSCLSDGHL